METKETREREREEDTHIDFDEIVEKKKDVHREMCHSSEEDKD